MSTEFPWSAVISGAVGIAGIAGTVCAVLLTNRAAERRVRLQQSYEDSRRFHAERRELFGKLLAQAQACREAAVGIRNHNSNPMTLVSTEQLMVPANSALSALSVTAKEVQLIATEQTEKSAGKLLEAAALLAVCSWRDEEEFKSHNHKLLDAETAFTEAARSELLAPLSLVASVGN